MVDTTILAMSDDERWLVSFWTEARRFPHARLVATQSINEACDLLDCAGTRLIALDCRAGDFSLDGLDRLLWANSTRAHPAAVMVIDQTYDGELAVALFQMGVDEYLSASNHFAQILAIIDRLLLGTGERELDRAARVPAWTRSTPLSQSASGLVASAVATA